MTRPKRTNDALDRLARAEEQFLQSEFLAPAVRGGQVQVRIAGVISRLQIEPADFEGFGVFKPISHTKARLLRPVRLAERRQYLELFPQVRLVLADRSDDEWRAAQAHRGDTRFQLEGLAPVHLVEDAQLFEEVLSRFDGARLWYEGPDPRWDPATGSYLRQALEKMIEPDELDRPGLTPEERLAYAVSYWPRFERSEEARRSKEERRLRKALAHAGAEFREFLDRGDVYTVTFEVDGERHVSAVSKKDMTVQVAGICLSGRDADFDLASLVGVIREGRDGHVVRVGPENQGMAEEQYWRVHPRRRRRRR